MKNLKILWITLVFVILDQITKIYIKSTMNLYESHEVWGDFFRITFVENPGMAFGIQFGQNKIFTVVAIVASVAILVYLYSLKGSMLIARVAMASILGGAIGNLTDRVLYGKVVDFLDFEFIDINIPAFKFLFIDFSGYSMTRWPVFNVADIAVVIGMGLLIIYIIWEEHLVKQENKVVAENGKVSPAVED